MLPGKSFVQLGAKLLFCIAACFFSEVAGHADLWTTAYYPGYEAGHLPASSIDFTALTHVIHFSVIPNTDGSLNTTANSITPASSADLISRAHAAGRKALICVGGADSQSRFEGATTNFNLASFVSNLTNFVGTYGYDGVDLDWEALPASDFTLYTNFVTTLRAALNKFPSYKMMTVAATAYPNYGDPANSEAAMFAKVQSNFDQINVMTYDLSGPYGGWVTWFNTPLYDGGYHFPGAPTELVPSADASINLFLTNGVAASKLAVGIAFYGDVWQGTTNVGITMPRQSWVSTNPPTVSQISYYSLMSTLYQSNLYHWDSAAQAAYLSITNSNSALDEFVSYDNADTCQTKVSYARNHHLGGVMIWELGEGYQPSQPAGQRDALLQSIKQSLATPGIVSLQISNRDVRLSFESLPLGLYRVLWTSDPSAGIWNTLTNNLPGSNGVLTATDTGALTNSSQRFYRIQTPP